MLDKIIWCKLLCIASNFSDKDDPLSIGVRQEHFETVDEIRAVERVTTDTHAERLT